MAHSEDPPVFGFLKNGLKRKVHFKNPQNRPIWGQFGVILGHFGPKDPNSVILVILVFLGFFGHHR
jgi:hypothetical protein